MTTYGTVVIGMVVTVVMVTLLSYCIYHCTAGLCDTQKTTSESGRWRGVEKMKEDWIKELKDVHSHFEEVKLEVNSVQALGISGDLAYIL